LGVIREEKKVFLLFGFLFCRVFWFHDVDVVRQCILTFKREALRNEKPHQQKKNPTD
jgi:hypothetical protein